MFNSKQRSNLRSKASVIEPIAQLGKNGINESFLDGLDGALEKRELVKVTVLENSGYEPKEAGQIVASALSAELVCAIGKKFVLYRRSNKQGVVHIEF